MAVIYRIRNNHEWANIIVDERSGTFSAVSSYGNFAYIWTHIGRSTLKEFLVGLDYCYFFGKTAATRGYVFSPEKTTEDLKRYIIEQRRDGSISKAKARSAWDDLERVEGRNESDYFHELSDARDLMDVLGWDYYDIARQEKDPQCLGFWSDIWPEFVKRQAPPDWGLLSVFFALLGILVLTFA